MSEPYIGEIRMFAGNFAPRGWSYCDGQLLAVSQNDALFSLLGTVYGGDGRTTFGLPDLRGRIPIHQGTGPGLSERRIGAKAGAEQVTLTTNQLPSHTHALTGNTQAGSEGSPDQAMPAQSTVGVYIRSPQPASVKPLKSDSLTNTGSSQPHSNLMQTLAIHYIIALVGIYPSRR